MLFFRPQCASVLSFCLAVVISWNSLEAASRQAVASRTGLVVTTSPYASEIGAKVLKQGGNAADAAVAVALTLAVTWPAAGNLGGGGFALLRRPTGESFFIDYRETAPQAARAQFYLDKEGQVIPEASSVGYRAVGVPGTPAGLALIHKRWGRLPWSRLVEPARRLAADGYRLEESHARMLEQNKDLLRRFPASQKIFFPKAAAPAAGDLFIQKDLAKSLSLLQKGGVQVFYQGALAKSLVSAIQKEGGVLTLKDLAAYKAEVREPVHGHFQDFDVITAPPPSSGGTVLLEMLGMLAHDDLKALGYGSAAYSHLLVETMKRAFADRSEWFGDPAYIKNPITELVRPSYLAARRGTIKDARATPSSEIKAGDLGAIEKPDTTHFTIIDAEGMIVSNTYTLNGSFGSGAVAAGTGILLNNEMDDFAAKPGTPNMYGLLQNERNAIAPGKRPLSSMTPTIVLKDGKAILALGSPGGPTIINSVLQVMLNVLIHGMSIQEAIDAPRLHHQWMPDKVSWEPFGINPDTRRILEGQGHVFADKPRFMGDVQAVSFDAVRNQWVGGSDSRWGGSVAVP